MRSEGYSTQFVCHCVCVSETTLQASVVKETLKFRHQQSVNDTLQCFDSWILLTMLGSRDMAKFVSQEAYDGTIYTNVRATSAHLRANHVLLQFVIEHVFIFRFQSDFRVIKIVTDSVSERFPVVCCPTYLRVLVQACLYARLVLVVVI